MNLCHKGTLGTFLVLNNVALGFMPLTSLHLKQPVSRYASTLKSAVVADGVNGLDTPKAWDCDEEANCVLVEACDEVQCRTTLDVRIHGNWYDLSGE